MVLEELLGLISLFGAQIFCIHKKIKVIIIYDNENLIFAIF